MPSNMVLPRATRTVVHTPSLIRCSVVSVLELENRLHFFL